MEVTCPACAARYAADDDKLRGRTARMRCKACDAVWRVTGPGASPLERSASVAGGALDPSGGKRAAVVRRGGERDQRDLFAEREPDEGAIRVKDTLLPPASSGFGGVGARNENSVLFRVDQLAGAARVKAPEPARPPVAAAPAVDDEGVIDLNALASVPPRAVKPIVAPLFSEPPPAVTVEVEETVGRAAAKPLNKLALGGIVAAAAAFVLVAGYAVSLAFSSDEPVKHTAAMIAEPPAAPPAPEVAPAEQVPASVVLATSSSEDTNENDANEAKSTKGKKTKWRAKARAKAREKAREKAAAPATHGAPARPVKAADPCRCKGDFNCILACTAKGGR